MSPVWRSQIGPRNSSWHEARYAPVVGLSLEHHAVDSMELKENILQSPAFVISADKTFGPTDFTSTYSMCTRRVFGGIGHRTQAFRSGVRCSNHYATDRS
ncbi:hypothetical protein TNCV_2990251 [Trichonephila clavipes]|nr:hypothetical protein TNCV_2990251 [Trichonephila clavipes]